MKRIVLDTNCLLMSLPKNSPYREIWNAFLDGRIILCVSNEILEEYLEIFSQKTTETIANNVISTILNRFNVVLITPYYKFELIQADVDDNKFVDCAIAAGAEYLVSNDAHFRVLKSNTFPRVNIINLKSFLKVMQMNKPYCIDSETEEMLNEAEVEYKTLGRNM